MSALRQGPNFVSPVAQSMQGRPTPPDATEVSSIAIRWLSMSRGGCSSSCTHDVSLWQQLCNTLFTWWPAAKHRTCTCFGHGKMCCPLCRPSPSAFTALKIWQLSRPTSTTCQQAVLLISLSTARMKVCGKARHARMRESQTPARPIYFSSCYFTLQSHAMHGAVPPATHSDTPCSKPQIMLLLLLLPLSICCLWACRRRHPYLP